MPRVNGGNKIHSHRRTNRFVTAALILSTCSIVKKLTIFVCAQDKFEPVFTEVKSWLGNKQAELQKNAFISYDSDGSPYPSNLYSYGDFISVLESMSVGGVGGASNKLRFYIGADGKGALYGLVNVAAFLAHAMAVSIQYDVCDEFNVDDFLERDNFALSNSCGQWGRNYQDEVCTGMFRSMTCDVDTNANIVAVSSFNHGNSSIPAFECRPKAHDEDFTGYWNSETGEIIDGAFSNQHGRNDVEGCCWFGRGVLLTRGTCNFGRINYYLGINALSMGFSNHYEVDFCTYPEVVCDSPYSKDLRWAVGLFEWIDRVQAYNDTRSYMDELENFIQSRLNRTMAIQFIDTVGWALPVSCSEATPSCDSIVDKQLAEERRDNFILLIRLLKLIQYSPKEPATETSTDATIPYISATAVYSATTVSGGGSESRPIVEAIESNNGAQASGGNGIEESGSNYAVEASGGDGAEAGGSVNNTFWYPVNTGNFEEGICVETIETSQILVTSAYASGLECCVEFFNLQTDGACLNQLQKVTGQPVYFMPVESMPRNPSPKPSPRGGPSTPRPADQLTYYPTIFDTATGIIRLPPSGSQKSYTFPAVYLFLPAFILILICY